MVLFPHTCFSESVKWRLKLQLMSCFLFISKQNILIMHLINTTKHLLCVKYKENEVISFLGKHKNCDNLTIFCSLDDIQIQGVL